MPEVLAWGVGLGESLNGGRTHDDFVLFECNLEF